jgi:hypothetical protein
MPKQSCSIWSVFFATIPPRLLTPFQDGTLTDSIAAVEAAWGKVADDLNLPRDQVIAATHGRRATDNLAALKPHIKPHEMPAEVEAFERTILAYADAYNNRRTRPRISSMGEGATSPQSSTGDSTPPSDSSASPALDPSAVFTPADTPPSLTPDSSNPSSRRSSETKFGKPFVQAMTAIQPLVDKASIASEPLEDTINSEGLDKESLPSEDLKSTLASDVAVALEVEEEAEDRSIRVLPGVHRIIDSIPDGRYAVATSGAKTYGACPLFPSENVILTIHTDPQHTAH